MEGMTGATKLQQWMEGRGLKQSAFAALANVPGPQVSLWLNERRRPSISSALKIESATGGFVRVADWAAPSPRRHRAA
jgi:DNA-binding transcriptional regulator YdaS (Cro superfamily)